MPLNLSNPWLVDAGESHTCAIDDTGVRCWGLNDYGQSDAPALSNPVAVSLGYKHSCALDDTGVVCWGLGNVGQTNTPAALPFDKDLDGLLDSVEDANGNGIVDAGETDPLDADSDDDTFSDGQEIAAGSNPLDYGSTPLSILPQGDLNGDTVVDVSDVLLGLRLLLGEVPMTPQYLSRGDVAPLVGGESQPDGVFDLGDLLIIQRKVLNW